MYKIFITNVNDEDFLALVDYLKERDTTIEFDVEYHVLFVLDSILCWVEDQLVDKCMQYTVERHY